MPVSISFRTVARAPASSAAVGRVCVHESSSEAAPASSAAVGRECVHESSSEAAVVGVEEAAQSPLVDWAASLAWLGPRRSRAARPSRAGSSAIGDSAARSRLRPLETENIRRTSAPGERVSNPLCGGVAELARYQRKYGQPARHPRRRNV
jgi:hypothetical protein